MLISEKLIQPTDMLVHTVKLFKIHKDEFEDIPKQAYRGMLKMDNNQTRDKLIPGPKDCLKKIDLVVPPFIKERTYKMRRWLSEAITALSRSTTTVEDFVE